MMFLLNRWDTLMNYNPETSFDEGRVKIRQFDEFFKQIESMINMNQCSVKDTEQKWSINEIELNNYLNQT